jgi:hypothetical protein
MMLAFKINRGTAGSKNFSVEHDDKFQLHIPRKSIDLKYFYPQIKEKTLPVVTSEMTHHSFELSCHAITGLT